MTARRNRYCKQCGGEAPEGTRISKNGLCRPCGLRNHNESLTALHDQRGPVYDKWAEGMEESQAASELVMAGYDASELAPMLCPSCGYRVQTASGLCVICLRDQALAETG